MGKRFEVIWWRNLEDWEEKFERRIPQPRVASGVVCKLPAAFPSPKLNKSFRVYHISCYWINIQVDSTSSNLASAMLNLKIKPRRAVGYGVKIFHPSPPNYVTRSPGLFQSTSTVTLKEPIMNHFLWGVGRNGQWIGKTSKQVSDPQWAVSVQ